MTAAATRLAPVRVLWLGLALLAAAAAAQTPYKVVAPDGRVTYTDRPAAPASGVQVQPLRRDALVSVPGGVVLPLDLQAVAGRFPVTLYSSSDCAPCDSGRRLLQQRGVPYSERLVASDEDIAALQRLSGAATVPTLTVGAQALRGWLESDWQTTLDLAGYPKASRLPPGWQAPAPVPLVARSAPPTPAEAGAAPRAPAPAAAPPAATPPPSGIRF